MIYDVRSGPLGDPDIERGNVMIRSYALLVIATTLAGTLGLAGTAHAGESGPVTAESTGGSASVTFTWVGRGSMNDIDLLVTDTRCDARGSYAQLAFERPEGKPTVVKDAHWNKIGCNGTKAHNDLSFRDGFDAKSFYLISCTDTDSDNKADADDQCVRSNSVDNPLT